MIVSDKSLDTIKDKPFILESKTGLIRNNFSPVIDMKGYLLFDVIAFDTGGNFENISFKIYVTNCLLFQIHIMILLKLKYQ